MYDNYSGLILNINSFCFYILIFQDDEDGDEAEEESEGGEQDDEMDAQQGPGSPGNGIAGGLA